MHHPFRKFDRGREKNSPNAARTVYPNVLPLTISHCAEMSNPNPARRQRSAMNNVWFETPRKPILDKESVIKVVANAPKPNGFF
jgi:hypothetical protein